MKRLVIILSLVLILTAFKSPKDLPKTIAEEKTQKTIALQQHRYHYYIRVKLNNRNANLIVDTGAAASLLDINQANDYNFKINKTSRMFAGAGGVSYQYTVSKYQFHHEEDQLNLYPLGADLSRVVESFDDDGNGIEIAGVLGSDFMRKHDAIIDYKNQTLIINK